MRFSNIYHWISKSFRRTRPGEQHTPDNPAIVDHHHPMPSGRRLLHSACFGGCADFNTSLEALVSQVDDDVDPQETVPFDTTNTGPFQLSNHYHNGSSGSLPQSHRNVNYSVAESTYDDNDTHEFISPVVSPYPFSTNSASEIISFPPSQSISPGSISNNIGSALIHSPVASAPYLTFSSLPNEIVQQIFQFAVSNDTTFDFSMKGHQLICSVNKQWRNVAMSDPRLWDIALFNGRQLEVHPPIYNHVHSMGRPMIIRRVALHLPICATTQELRELDGFLNTHLRHYPHVHIHTPTYREDSNLAFSKRQNTRYATNIRVTDLFDILRIINPSPSLQVFSWSSSNRLERSLSSFLVDSLNSGNTTSESDDTSGTLPDDKSESSLTPAEMWPNLSHLRVACLISFHDCISTLNQFPSLFSATFGPIYFFNLTPTTVHPNQSHFTQLQSLSLIFDAVFDAQVALHELFGDSGCLLGQPLESLSITCKNGVATANISATRTKTTSPLQCHQLATLELVNVPFVHGVHLLRRWHPDTRLMTLAWKNDLRSSEHVSRSTGDIIPSTPATQDLKSLLLSFCPYLDTDERTFWSYTSMLVSQLRSSSGVETASDVPRSELSPLSLVLSHRPKSFTSLFDLPLVSLTISRPISTVDCLMIMSGCTQLQELDVAIHKEENWNGLYVSPHPPFMSLSINALCHGLLHSLFSFLQLNSRLTIDIKWGLNIEQWEKDRVQEYFVNQGVCVRTRVGQSINVD